HYSLERGRLGHMKRILIASSIAFALASGSAMAADLAVKAPLVEPPAPPPVSWTGCYVNAGIGYGLYDQESFTEVSSTLAASSNTTNFGGRGWLGRAGGGCDYQVASWVVGLLGDYDFMNVKGQYMDPLSGFIGQEKETAAWAVGGRIGYLITPS